jgi:hypothetical protein
MKTTTLGRSADIDKIMNGATPVAGPSPEDT